jgi:hypothetical protein
MKCTPNTPDDGDGLRRSGRLAAKRRAEEQDQGSGEEEEVTRVVKKRESDAPTSGKSAPKKRKSVMKKEEEKERSGGLTLADVPHSVLKHLILPHVKDETVLVLSQTCKRLNGICSSYLLIRSEEMFPEVPPQVMNIVAKVRCEKMFGELDSNDIRWPFVRTFFRLTRSNWDALSFGEKTIGGILKATLVQFKGASGWYETDIALRKNAETLGSIEERELRLNQFKGWRLLPDASVRFLEAYRLHGTESKQEIDPLLNESVLKAELARRIAEETGESPKLILEYLNILYTNGGNLTAKEIRLPVEEVVEAFEAREERNIFVKVRALKLVPHLSKFLKEEFGVYYQTVYFLGYRWTGCNVNDLLALLRTLPDQKLTKSYLSEETSLENALEEILPQVRDRWQEWRDATDLVKFRGFGCDSFVARAYDVEKFAKYKFYVFVVSHSVLCFRLFSLIF